MSRAFVKEADGSELDQLPERQHSDHVNYITPAGMRDLEGRVRDLEGEATSLQSSDRLDAKSKLALVQRDLRFYRERLRRAIPTQPPRDPVEVRFGVKVTLLDDNGDTHVFVIAGEDETDVARGRVSWVSPLARTLTGLGVGDTAAWQRGVDVLQVEIVNIESA